MAETMVMIPFRAKSETIEQIDTVVKTFGGTKSEFIRRAVEEKLARMERMMEVIANVDGDPFFAIPSEYHGEADLSPVRESETSND